MGSFALEDLCRKDTLGLLPTCKSRPVLNHTSSPRRPSTPWNAA